VIGIFFPQRVALKLDGCSYSPQVLKKAITVSSHAPSFLLGSKLLSVVGGIKISGRQLNKLTTRIGSEIVAAQGVRRAAYFDQPLPRKPQEPATPISLAVVSNDGGMMQTRRAGGGRGVHDPHWRETKNALFLRMNSISFDADPHPHLPACFADPRQMKTLLAGINTESIAGPEANQLAEETPSNWRPEVLYRTCLSSLADSEAFGRMMACEADSRGFYCARKQAYVADGLPYNWTIQKRYFPSFVPILDFVHAIEHLYVAARHVTEDDASAWQLFRRWSEVCWQGQILDVITELRTHQQRLGEPPPDCDATDSRRVVAKAIGYFETNASRMKYAEYRQAGLPTTSAHMESFVKELNYRVKSTEKFWNDGPSGEAILAIRSAALSDDNRLNSHLCNRPGQPFRPNIKQPKPSLANAS